ncbi:MAG TPA: hypothetical protein VNY05_41295 [Candidatus Acidoferrales bacterium]|nr:hypothetical protein [Candidatus Acidoferrales bacterium]
MTAVDVVDGGLEGFGEGEVVTISWLPGFLDWTANEMARQAVALMLSTSWAARRYGVAG